MADSIIDLVYYALISALSTWLYYDRLSRRKGTFVCRRMVLVAVLIFLSHLMMFIPADDGWMTVIYIGQIVVEFYIIVLMFDEKIINKLIAYIEINVAIGIGITAGYIMLKLSMSEQDVFAEAGTFEKLLFYLVTLVMTGVICFMLSYVDKRKDKTDNMKGVEASVVICIALLCTLYAAGMTMVELRDNWRLWVVYGYFAIVTTMVMILLYMNKRLQQNEDMNIRYQVLSTIHDNMAELEQELEEEAQYYQGKREWLENTLAEIYEDVDMAMDKVIKALLENKMSKAARSGVDIKCEIECANTGKWNVYDVISIYSNLIDNAIRATGENVHRDKIIKVKGQVSYEAFYLMVENHYETEPVKKDGEYVTTKTDEGQHGLGIKSVTSIAEKYGMKVEINTDNNVFRVVVQDNEKK